MSRLRLFLDTAAGAFAPGRVQYLILFVTSRCNARCKMCFNWQALDSPGGVDLSLAEIQGLAQGLPGLIQLTLSGGEPFLRADLLEIVEAFYKHSRVRQVTLPTNGTLTERISEVFPELLRRFPDLSLNLDLSIDGVGAEHDYIRGVPGAYERAIETYRRAREWKKQYPHFRLGMSAVLSSFNQDKIIALLEHMEREFVLDRREVMLARGSTRDSVARDVSLEIYEQCHAWIKEHDRALSRGIFARVNYHLAVMMREILLRTAREERMVIPCLAGFKMAVVDADGTVRPCEILHTLYPQGRPDFGLENFVLGSLRELPDISVIMNSEKAMRVRRFIRETRCWCTFECALFNGIVFNPRCWPNLAWRILGRG